MYVGGRGNRTARAYSRAWNAILHLGLLPRRWVTLEVRGRTTGRLARFPLGLADVGGEWFVVSMLGECNWVSSVRAAQGRAAQGRAALRRRRSRPVVLVEVPVAERAPILRRYAVKVPGGRPHLRATRHDPVEAFAVISADHPVFRVTPAP